MISFQIVKDQAQKFGVKIPQQILQLELAYLKQTRCLTLLHSNLRKPNLRPENRAAIERQIKQAQTTLNGLATNCQKVGEEFLAKLKTDTAAASPGVVPRLFQIRKISSDKKYMEKLEQEFSELEQMKKAIFSQPSMRRGKR